MKCTGFAFSVIGGREMNQDSLLVNNTKRLYAVADGVGGGMKGEVASGMAVSGLEELTSGPEDRLSSVFKRLQARVYQQAMSDFGEPVMGTTLTAVRAGDGEMTVCHAGDSRCYLFTKSILKLLTEDHEFYDDRVQGTVLSSYLGVPEELHPLTIAEEIVKIEIGDRVLICSDGLYRQMQESRIAQLFREYLDDSKALAKKLCEEASQKPHSDNVTVIIVEVEA